MPVVYLCPFPWETLNSGIIATPAAKNGSVFFGDVDGKFHCIDALTGKNRWTVAAEADILAPPNFYQDSILFGCEDHYLYCVSSEGRILWRTKTKDKIRGAPAVVEDKIFLAGCDKLLHVFDANTGNETAVMSLGGNVGASVAVHADCGYVGTMQNKFIAFDWKKAAIIWAFEPKRGAQAFYSSPAVTSEYVIVGSRDRKVHALNRENGKEVWAFPTQDHVDSSPAVFGNRVVVGSLDGNLYVLNLIDGTELARFSIGPICSAPAVGSRCVVVSTLRGQVVCLGAEK